MESLTTMDYKIIPEPVDMWKNFQNTNIIREMYKFRELTSLGQIFIHMTLLEEYSKTKNSKKFMERSIFDSQNVFTLNLYRENFISKIEYDLLSYMHETIVSTYNIKEPIYIYLNTPIHLCRMHVEFKQDKEDYYITNELLWQLKRLYDEWVIKILISKKRILILDGNRSADDLKDRLIKFIEYINDLPKEK